MLKFYVRYAIVVDEVHETISSKQKCLEKYVTFNRQKRKKSKNRFEKQIYKLLTNAFLEKQWTMYEIVYDSILLKKYDYQKFIKQQSK